MAKTYLSRILWVLSVLLLFWGTPVSAAESYSELFIKITDATTAVKDGDQAKAKELVEELQADFASKTNHDSEAGKKSESGLGNRGGSDREQVDSGFSGDFGL
ncbi:Ferrous iron transport permease EfeU [Streptococcus sp. DD10]|nr:Ferrous iron transport permease EfeU [Streptococcus sp. DD10]